MMPAHYTIFVVCFPDEAGVYDTLLNVLVHSIKLNTHANVVCLRDTVKPPEWMNDTHAALHENPFLYYNTAKLAYWNNFVQQADEPVVLLDADMLVLQDLQHVFDYSFDVGITRRKDGLLNGGAIYVHPTQGAKNFMSDWVKENNELYTNLDALESMQSIQPGMNQPALYNVLQNQGEYNIQELPCNRYNCMDCCWEDTPINGVAVAHIKGMLRKWCLGASPLPDNPLDLVSVWNDYHRTWKRWQAKDYSLN